MRERLDSWFWSLPGEVVAGLVTGAMAPWWYLLVVLARGAW